MDDLDLEINILPQPIEDSRKINENRIGRKIGRSIITAYSHTKSDVNWWRFKCECGNEGVASVASLKRRVKNGGYCKKCFAKSPDYWKKAKDYSESQFGDLTVLNMAENRGGHTYWNCKCKCGNKESIALSSLKKNENKCCSVCYKKTKLNDQTNNSCKNKIKIGEKINSFVILSKERVSEKTFFRCLCDCGRESLLSRGSVFKSKFCKFCLYESRRGAGSNTFKDLTGLKFKDWEVIKFSHFNNDSYWKCKNSKNEERVLKGSYLAFYSKRKKKDKTLFASRKERIEKFENKYRHLLGQKIKNYTIISFNHYLNKNNHLVHDFKCQCKCGKITNYRLSTLTNTSVKNCYNCWDKNGPNNPNYNSSIPDSERFFIRRLDPRNKVWKKEVFSRDKYTCQITNKKGQICAHHLFSWRSNPDTRYDKENGIAILQSVHKEFHKRYGYGNNTKEQFEEFISLLTPAEIDSFPKYIGLTKEEKNLIIKHLTIILLWNYPKPSSETNSVSMTT